MDNDTIFEEESRFYVNPQTSLNEQQQFLSTLRDIQAQNTAEINQNTYNLGSPVTSNIGGLTGSEGLWQAQYQTPQTQATVAGLKAAMQQQALNTELQNQQNFWKNRYNQAQRRYNRAASTYPTTKVPEGTGLNKVATPEGSAAGTLRTGPAGTSVVETGQYDKNGNPIIGVYDTEAAFTGTAKPLKTYGGTPSTTDNTQSNVTGDVLGSNAAAAVLANPLLGSAVLGGVALRKLFGWGNNGD